MLTIILILAGIVCLMVAIGLCCGNGRRRDSWGSPREIMGHDRYGRWSVSSALDWFIGCDGGVDVARLI